MSSDPIRSEDPQAVQKLEAKLARLTADQERMKRVNAYYRKHKTLEGCPDMTPEEVQKKTARMKPGRPPYLPWELSNNNAVIREAKRRIAQLTRQAEQGYVGWEFDGGDVEADTEAVRLKIRFDEKPDREVTAQLKHGGFHWSPSLGVWQRLLNDNAIYAADGVKVIWPASGERPSEYQRRARAEG